MAVGSAAPESWREKLRIVRDLTRRAARDVAAVGWPTSLALLYCEVSTRRPLTWLAPTTPNRLIRLRVPGQQMPFYVRHGTSDIDTYRQIFIWREYAHLLSVRDPAVMVDCGANIGASSVFLLSAFPRARVIAIEPEPASYDLCVRNLSPFGSRARVLRAAVWPKNGVLQLVRPTDARAEWATSVTESTADSGDVTAISLHDVVRELGDARINILKMDIEGAERPIFDDLTRDHWLSRVDNIAIELHGAACAQSFRAALERYSFELTLVSETTYACNLRELRVG